MIVNDTANGHSIVVAPDGNIFGIDLGISLSLSSYDHVLMCFSHGTQVMTLSISGQV